MKRHGAFFLHVPIFLLAALFAEAQPADPEQVTDLVFYGDARGGVLQTFLNGNHRPTEIHGAVAKRIGSLEGLAEQRAIVFLGDAVSHGGCYKYWEKDFFPALRNLTAFRRDGDYLFYPVIGDHETFLIPESYDEVGKEPLLCVLFKQLYRVPGKKQIQVRRAAVSEELHGKVMAPSALPSQRKCPKETEKICKNPGIKKVESQHAHCESCAFQRKHCSGNCVTYTFEHSYSRENGFAPFQDAWRTSPKGATWYKVDFLLTNAAAARRELRVLLLDTQAAADLKARDGKLQADWMTDRVVELEAGAFVVVAGHQPPPLRPDLYEPILRAAFRRGIQVLAVVAAHYHGFGSGVYLVSSDEMPDAAAQEVYFALSGDGGGRDLDMKERPTEERMVGGRIGTHLRVVSKPESPWIVDTDENAASFLRIRVTYEGLQVTDYQVPLESVKLASRGRHPARHVVRPKKATPLRSTNLSRGAPR